MRPPASCCSATSTRAASPSSPTARPRKSSASDRAEGVQLADGRDVPGRPRRAGDRHPPQYRSGRDRRARCQSRHRRSATTCAPAIPTSTRSANASSIAARSSAWSRRSGTRPRSAPRGWPATRARSSYRRPLVTSLKITGVDVFSAGALPAADEADDEITLHDDNARRLQEGGPARRPAGRRRALRRCRRRPLVSRS